MGDLLAALRKEKVILSNRVYMMDMYIKKQSEVISKTPYTEVDLENAKHRLAEVEVCIGAIVSYRVANSIREIKET